MGPPVEQIDGCGYINIAAGRNREIKVERPVTRPPPRRSRRAVLPHRALRICSLTHWQALYKELQLLVSKPVLFVFRCPSRYSPQWGLHGSSSLSYPGHVSFTSYTDPSSPSPCGRLSRLGVLWDDL